MSGIIFECLRKKKSEFRFFLKLPTVIVAVILAKNNCKSFRKRKIRYFSSLSDTIYPEKKSGLLSASSSNQLSITHRHNIDSTNVVHQHRRHTDGMQYLAYHSRQARLTLTRTHTTTDHRREHGGSKRELAYGVDAGRWAV